MCLVKLMQLQYDLFFFQLLLPLELQEAFTMNCSPENTIPPSKLGVVIRSIGRAPTEAQLQSLCREFESKGLN